MTVARTTGSSYIACSFMRSSALSGESAEEEVSADGERQEGKARLSVRERRRPREKRRSTGVSYRPLDVIFVFASLLFFFFSFLLCFYFVLQ